MAVRPTSRSEDNAVRRFATRFVPILVVLAVIVALMYPVALWLGLPMAKLRMDNLANWLVNTTHAHPLRDVPAGAATSGGPAVTAPAVTPAGTTLHFGAFDELTDVDPGEGVVVPVRDVDRLVLVRGGAPVTASFKVENESIVLDTPVLGALLEWGSQLEGPLDATTITLPAAVVPPITQVVGFLYQFPDPALVGSPLYLDGRLLEAGAVASVERADGVSREFTFPVGSGPVLVNDRLLEEGRDFEADGIRVTLAAAPPFNASLRRITRDYAVLDASNGTVALAFRSAAAPQAAADALSLAELLVGPVDGTNRTFYLQHAPLVENDPSRQLMLDGVELSATAERPQERVDGQNFAFTFPGTRGVVTVNGVELEEGRDYTRSGNIVVFSRVPVRNAQLRQYQDYLVSDPASGAVTLAVAPQPGQKLWAASYTYYDRPACGASEMECFFTMPQHPMPFPHWIAQRIGPFLTAYPFTDSRNVIRATIYTAGGTLLALLLGGLLGVLLAVVFVAIRPAERALLPWVIASQTVPIIALVPVLLLLLGNVGVTVQTSLVPAALIGAYIAFFPVAVGTVTGLRSVDPLALDLMKSYAATPLEVFWKVRFPAAVPFFFTSLKLGAAAALVGALVAETESNNRFGLGYAIVGQVQAGNVSDVWILLLISAALGIGLVALVGLAQRVLAPWERR